MPLSVGDKLGPYEILAPIGAGGMGEVYRAHDPRLRRDVAIKISAAQFTERFEREAQMIAALNHPNICTLYDVGPNYLLPLGRTAEAVEQSRLALDSDPLSMFLHLGVAFMLYFAKQYNDSIACARRALEIELNSYFMWHVLGEG